MSSSLSLHDPGEEAWPIKLHLGCGGIYLADAGSGYKNIDIDGQPAADHRDILGNNRTHISDYYSRLRSDWESLSVARPTLVDGLADMSDLPYMHASVDKIVAIQAFEHLSPTRAAFTLRHWALLLRDGGVLILSVPDMAQTLEWIEQDDRRAFALRHLRGSLRTPHSRHWAWYTRETLPELLQAHGFEVSLLPNFHAYPAVVVRGVRCG